MHYFSEKLRGFYLYANGINSRSINLAKTYFIDTIKIDKDDIIFDCGANSGDLYPYLSKSHTFTKLSHLNLVIQTLFLSKKNAPKSINNNLGLHEAKGLKRFYISSRGGDSSFIEPANGYDEVLEIETTTIDDYCHQNNIKNIKLLS